MKVNHSPRSRARPSTPLRQRTTAQIEPVGKAKTAQGRKLTAHDIQLAKQSTARNGGAKSGKGKAGKKMSAASRPKSSQKSPAKTAVKSTAAPAKKAGGLAQLLSPKGIQDSLKSVGSLRNSVKNWLRYLEQADQVLETIYATSNSLKESGVLEKIVKQKGKNLTTEDFANILVALMNSPIGGQVFKGGGDETDASETPAAPATGSANSGGSGASAATGTQGGTGIPGAAPAPGQPQGFPPPYPQQPYAQPPYPQQPPPQQPPQYPQQPYGPQM